MLRLVINLDRSVDRWKCIESQFHSLGLDMHRVSAVDAKRGDISSAFLQNKVAALGSPEKYFYPRELGLPAIGCYLSHMECWKLLLQSNEQWAAIVEDDVLFSQLAKHFLSSSDWIPADTHILQLHTIEKQWRCRTLKKHIPISETHAIHYVIEQSFGTCCYLIDRKAAQVALSLSNLLSAPVDQFLFNFKSPFTQQFPAARLNPTCVLHNDSHPSTISGIQLQRDKAYSIRNHLSPKRLYLSAKKKFINNFLCEDTVFTWD